MAVGVGFDVGERAFEQGLALAELLEIEPDRFQDVEAVVDAGEALRDLDLVLRERLDASVERRLAAGLEFVDALGQAVMAEAELADQGIDAGVRRAQRDQLGMGFRQIFLVLAEGHESVLDRVHP
ncbi:hypothetical protein [Bradyrhizobium sp. S3.14.4]